VRAADDDDVVDGAPADAVEHGAEQHALLGRAEAGRRPGGENDRGRLTTYNRAGYARGG
jgi:hypothetical protein